MTPSGPGPDVVLCTMGDPHGIGPEVLLKALSARRPPGALAIFGDPDYLVHLNRQLGLPPLDGVDLVRAAPFPFPPQWGQIDARAGEFSLACLEAALDHIRTDQRTLLVTAPVSKRAMYLAGVPAGGQTELLARRFPAHRPAMVFLSPRLKVLVVTRHLPLSQVSGHLEANDLVGQLRLLADCLERLGISEPRLALCGLNPHASESGLFGEEEASLITPALERLRKEAGLEVAGPLPADTLFGRAVAGEFDAVAALYHDQGLIPLKLLALHSAAQVTLGLPLLRTSPSHGTAFDLAGRGSANPGSMLAAFDWGVRLLRGGEPSQRKGAPPSPSACS